MKCIRLKDDKKSCMNMKKGNVENMAATVNDKANRKNDSSPQSKEFPISSTPLRKINSSTNAEESPDIDCYPSPIFPCTQEGGNEVAWDWQSSLNKTPESRNRKQNVHTETPKGTKLLQKKRNSNSPLLYKPLKRKTIKMESMDNIGQFAAELQALNEKVKCIQQTDKNSGGPTEEKRSPILANTSNKEEIMEIQDEEQNYVGEIGSFDNAGKTVAKNDASYDDLFDDSIDDSMARCTQEIEEKFNLITDNGHSPQPSVKQEEEEDEEEDELFSKLTDKTSQVQFTSSTSVKGPSARNFFHKSMSDSGMLKTYSRLSSKRDANLGAHASAQTENDLHKSHKVNNGNTTRCHTEKSRDNCARLPTTSNIAELFDIPDDSFDDCLASCVEDEKLTASTGFGDAPNRRTIDSTKYDANYKKHLVHAPMKSEAKSASSVKAAAKKDGTSGCGFFENRKFFKTKSLSDQYIGQDAIANAKSKSNASSSTTCLARSKLHWNSTKTSTTTVAPATRGSVSSNPIVTNDGRMIDEVGSTISLMRDSSDRTHGSDVNRCAVKEGGDRFGRYNSTGNMRNGARETTSNGGSQPARCSAEEIERKRLQAKMRLEAKRKMYTLKITSNINR